MADCLPRPKKRPCFGSPKKLRAGFTRIISPYWVWFPCWLAGASYWAASCNKFALILVVVALAANWLGDSLDGTLARVRNCQRPRYGYYVDHVIDLIGTAALLGGLAVSGYMNHTLALMLLAAFALVEAEVFLATHVQHVFRLSCFCVGPTELRVVLAAGTLYLLYDPWIRLGGKGPFLLFDVGGIVAIAGLLAAFVYSAIRNACLLYRAEPQSLLDAPVNRPGQFRCEARHGHCLRYASDSETLACL